jgi:hypothetical protein
MKSIASACVIVTFLVLGACAPNTVKIAKDSAFQWTSPTKKVLFIQPDVQLGELSAGGDFSPRADWTTLAQGYISSDAAAMLRQKDVDLVTAGSDVTPHDAQLIKLYAVVGQAIVLHLYTPNYTLPSKGDALDWTLGPGTLEMRQRYGADYALFIYVRDSYTTTGRAVMMLGAALFGVAIPGGTQVGFASLVDLRTGNIVWFNHIVNGSGDLRSAPPAQDTMSALLKDLPL